jgi:hypothetical protein
MSVFFALSTQMIVTIEKHMPTEPAILLITNFQGIPIFFLLKNASVSQQSIIGLWAQLKH